jgi:beta-lactam-binding protein with PASTA domain
MATRQRPTGSAEPTELITPPPGEPPEPPPDREFWPWLLVLGLLVLAGLAALWYASRDSSGAPAAQTQVTTVTTAPATTKSKPAVAKVSVPDLVGQQRADAVRTLDAAGLKAGVNEVPSDQEKGLVVAQDPRGGTKVDKGAAVTLNVSKGKEKPKPKPAQQAPATVTVPNLVGASKDAAKASLRSAGLEPSTEDVPSTQPKDTIVSQSPSGGSTAHQGDHVLLNVSEGPPAQKAKPKPKPKSANQPSQQQQATASVPSVVGEDEATASAEIQAAGFRVSTVDQPTSDPSQDGIVVDQSPPAGSDADADSTVTIYVGRSSSG